MSVRPRRAGLTVLVALVGLALAVAIAVLTSSLTTQHVEAPVRMVAPDGR